MHSEHTPQVNLTAPNYFLSFLGRQNILRKWQQRHLYIRQIWRTHTASLLSRIKLLSFTSCSEKYPKILGTAPSLYYVNLRKVDTLSQTLLSIYEEFNYKFIILRAKYYWISYYVVVLPQKVTGCIYVMYLKLFF